MYAALWRALPGPWPVRALTCVVLAALLLAACVRWVFPALADRLPVNDADLGAHAPRTPGPPTGPDRPAAATLELP